MLIDGIQHSLSDNVKLTRLKAECCDIKRTLRIPDSVNKRCLAWLNKIENYGKGRLSNSRRHLLRNTRIVDCSAFAARAVPGDRGVIEGKSI